MVMGKEDKIFLSLQKILLESPGIDNSIGKRLNLNRWKKIVIRNMSNSNINK